MKSALPLLLLLPLLVGCSASRHTAVHDPSHIYVFRSGNYVLGAYSKSHAPASLPADLIRERLSPPHALSIVVEPGTSQERLNDVIAVLRETGYQNITIRSRGSDEPNAPPNGGPAEPFGSSDAGGVPPSVS